MSTDSEALKSSFTMRPSTVSFEAGEQKPVSVELENQSIKDQAILDKHREKRSLLDASVRPQEAQDYWTEEKILMETADASYDRAFPRQSANLIEEVIEKKPRKKRYFQCDLVLTYKCPMCKSQKITKLKDASINNAIKKISHAPKGWKIDNKDNIFCSRKCLRKKLIRDIDNEL